MAGAVLWAAGRDDVGGGDVWWYRDGGGVECDVLQCAQATQVRSGQPISGSEGAGEGWVGMVRSLRVL